MLRGLGMCQAELHISTLFQIQQQCQSSSLTLLNETAGILRVATLGSLNYMLSIHHLSSKLSLDIEDSEVLD